MPYQPISEWTTNDGTVPSDVTADTILETKYRDKVVDIIHSKEGDFKNPLFWEILNDDRDIICYRKMKRV